jgi:uncharacterized linocin/CFP29 family protein
VCREEEVEEAAAEVVKDTVAAVKVRPIHDPQAVSDSTCSTDTIYILSFVYV